MTIAVQHTDIFGKPISVDSIVVYRRYDILDVGIVRELTPEKVKIKSLEGKICLNILAVDPKNCMLISPEDATLYLLKK